MQPGEIVIVNVSSAGQGLARGTRLTIVECLERADGAWGLLDTYTGTVDLKHVTFHHNGDITWFVWGGRIYQYNAIANQMMSDMENAA